MPKPPREPQAPTLAGSRHETAEASLGYLFWRAYNGWSRALRQDLETVGLTQAQYAILAALAYLGSAAEHVTQQDVAKQLGMDKMMVSDVVKTLEAKDFVTRAPHPRDRRAMTLRLTGAGRERLRQAVPLVEAADARFFGRIPAEGRRGFAAALLALGDDASLNPTKA